VGEDEFGKVWGGKAGRETTEEKGSLREGGSSGLALRLRRSHST
jgi:hypothetical protein